MDAIIQIFYNYPLMVAVTGWMTAQVIKTILTLIVTRELNWERMVGAGGMPSAHSASVCGLTLAIARSAGVADPLFAISFLFAGVVMYDAIGVRRAAGEQAKRLNLMAKTSEEGEDDSLTGMLKESLGHTPLEVLAGALLGIVIALVFPM